MWDLILIFVRRVEILCFFNLLTFSNSSLELNASLDPLIVLFEFRLHEYLFNFHQRQIFPGHVLDHTSIENYTVIQAKFS